MIIMHILILWEGRCACMHAHTHKITLDIMVKVKVHPTTGYEGPEGL
jgi:hypothetical protein